jgi:hypothetical protein
LRRASVTIGLIESGLMTTMDFWSVGVSRDHDGASRSYHRAHNTTVEPSGTS